MITTPDELATKAGIRTLMLVDVFVSRMRGTATVVYIQTLAISMGCLPIRTVMDTQADHA